MPEFVTKDHFDGAIHTIRRDIQDLVLYFNKSQGEQNKRLDSMDKRFDEVDAKLNAIMEILATRKELHNLIRALKRQGIKLKEAEIFRV